MIRLPLFWMIVGGVLVAECQAVSAQQAQQTTVPLQLAFQTYVATGHWKRSTAWLKLERESYRVGELAVADISFVAGDHQPWEKVLNPWLNGLVIQPVALLVFDDSKRFVGDYLDPSLNFGSHKPVSENDWVAVPSGGIVGGQAYFLAGRGPTAVTRSELRLGHYYMQACYYNAFVDEQSYLAHPFDALKQPWMEFEHYHFDRGILCRSNVVEFVVQK